MKFSLDSLHSLSDLTKKLTSTLSRFQSDSASILSRLGLETFGKSNRAITFNLPAETQLVEHALLVQRANFINEVNGEFNIECLLLCTSSYLSLSHFIGLPASLEFTTDTGSRYSMSGIITGFQLGQSDGGFATYRCTISSGLYFLNQRKNSRVFLDQTVIEIVSTIFAEFGSSFEVFASSVALDSKALAKTYPKLPFVYQANETDLAFIRRILAKAGVSYYVESTQSAGVAGALSKVNAAKKALGGGFSLNGLGSAAHSLLAGNGSSSFHHSVVLFDTSTARPQSSCKTEIPYHRSSAVDTSDSITGLVARRRLLAGTTVSQSFNVDYAAIRSQNNTTDSNNSNANGANLEHVTLRSPKYKEQPEQLATEDYLQLQRLMLDNKQFEAESSVRNAELGKWFKLTGNAELERNHSEDEKEFLILSITGTCLNNVPKDVVAISHSLLEDSPWGNNAEDWQYIDSTTPYRFKNRMVMVRRSVDVVPDYENVPKPTLYPMIGVVVGPAGEEVHTDAAYRVQVNLPQLRMVSHSAQGGRGANNAEGDSPWFPVVTQGSGNNFGQMWLPRVGSTVVLNFFNNDPDCPFVTGQMYDSSSHQPAQFSHKGSMPENRYMSGVVSKEIGGDRRNQIKIDDTSGQISTQISSDEGLSQANLGFLTTPRNGEAEARGLGLEIRTDHSGAIRAAKGLQISTHAQTDAKGQQMDASEAVSGLQSSHDQMQNLSDVAKHQNATPLETLANIQICIDALNATGDAKKAAAFKQAVLLLAGSDDIAITTPTNIHTHAGKSISQASGENTDVAVGKTYSLVAAKGLSLLSLDQGAKLFAAKGKVDIQAQSAGMDLFAAAGINITSTEDSIIISAAKKIILKADGSAIEIGGGIKLITRFGLDFKALQHTFLGPMGVNVSLPNLPSSFAGHFKFLNKSTGEEIPNQAYMITIPSGKNIYGHTGEDGKTHTRMTASAQQIKVQPLSSNLWHKSKNHLIDFDITADEENGESDEH